LSRRPGTLRLPGRGAPACDLECELGVVERKWEREEGALLLVRRDLLQPVRDLEAALTADEPVRALEPGDALRLKPDGDLLPDRVRAPLGHDRISGRRPAAQKPAAGGAGRDPAREVVEAWRGRV